MEVLLNLQNKNVTLNAVHVAPRGHKLLQPFEGSF